MENKGLETLKNITKDKNKEKLIYILICAVVILIASSYIFKKEDTSSVDSNKEKTVKQNYVFDTYSEEDKLSSILAKISGISEVSCYITYKDEGSIVPAYNKKEEIIYEEVGSEKTALIEKRLLPEIEGIIIVGKGMEDETVKAKIATAVASVMNIGVYKVQVFSKGE